MKQTNADLTSEEDMDIVSGQSTEKTSTESD